MLYSLHLVGSILLHLCLLGLSGGFGCCLRLLGLLYLLRGSSRSLSCGFLGLCLLIFGCFSCALHLLGSCILHRCLLGLSRLLGRCLLGFGSLLCGLHLVGSIL